MAATAELLKELAQISLTAEEQKKEIESFKIRYPDIRPEEAYRAMGMRLDLAEKKGHRMIGAKLGNTSMAKIAQVRDTMTLEGVKVNADPSYGFLFEYMPMKPEEILDLKDLIHPKVETELAFVTNRELYEIHDWFCKINPVRSPHSDRSTHFFLCPAHLSVFFSHA